MIFRRNADNDRKIVTVSAVIQKRATDIRDAVWTVGESKGIKGKFGRHVKGGNSEANGGHDAFCEMVVGEVP